MKSWLTQIKREFWEYNTSFISLPLVVAALLVIAAIYVVLFYADSDSKVAIELFGRGQQIEDQQAVDSNSASPDQDEAAANAAGNETNTSEFIVDFNTGEIRPITAAEITSRSESHGFMANAMLFAIHQIFIIIMSFIWLYYMLSCLYDDRKDRSILFWKSMPVSEFRAVAVKLFTAVFAAPLLVTLISWVIQICYLLLSMIYVYRIGSNPWEMIWANADIMQSFFQQMQFVIWAGAWMLPFSAWWLFASALARRSPFLVGTIPFVVVIVLENLLYGKTYVGIMMTQHFQTVAAQLQNIAGVENDITSMPGNVDFLLNYPEMLTGLVIAGILFPATVWLRNHRFEI